MRPTASLLAALAATALPFAACFKTDITCEDVGGDVNRTYPDCGEPPGLGGSGTTGSGGEAGDTGEGGARGGDSGRGGGKSGAGGAGNGGGGAAGGTSGKGGAGSGGSAGDSAAGGEAGTAGSGTPCDGASSPSEDECVIEENYGVFVSPMGDDDTGDGSRTKPYATLAKAIEVAQASDKRVYACGNAGAYPESVALDASASGLEMFGGFSCGDWSYSESRKARVASPSALALHVEGVTGLRIEDMRFEAADAAAPGESSVGALVVSSTGVAFRRVRVEAGSGMNGASGVLEPFGFPARVDLDGNGASGGAGGPGRGCLCPGGALTSGGAGGTAPTQSGGSGTPDYAGPGGEGGGSGLACGKGGTGQDGAPAPALAAGVGAMSFGVLTATGWTPASGSDGSNGSPGQGGGGGASSTMGGGGGGGCGGCGGAGGPGGQGGGASIALAVFESGVTLEDSELVSHDAGNGGSGAAGQTGQMEGGAGGLQAITACSGGAGGLGGDGAAGGGGAGGISVGVLWSGDAAPVVTSTVTMLGNAGAKGIGGEPGVNDGADGAAEEVSEAI